MAKSSIEGYLTHHTHSFQKVPVPKFSSALCALPLPQARRTSGGCWARRVSSQMLFEHSYVVLFYRLICVWLKVGDNFTWM